jgi:hypothetical protein
MRRLATGGFGLIGCVSAVVWVFSLCHGEHHQSAWKVLALAMSCFPWMQPESS